MRNLRLWLCRRKRARTNEARRVGTGPGSDWAKYNAIFNKFMQDGLSAPFCPEKYADRPVMRMLRDAKS